ncbi:EamA family transporter [Nocardioides insulae]|uniref:EamA family transporter n=1 Tax=Nocardioides insulae TaxID=394734 RepID=UPI00040B506D|nr:DMT family transporter [Nocardioides insulae]
MRRTVLGFVFMVVSAFFFAVSGPVAKTMYGIGWTPGSVVLVRLAGSALALMVPTLIALRGRWPEVARHWRTVVAYGLVSMAGVQGFYFIAVEHLTVAVALLLEMTAPLLIVFWLWARSRLRPSTTTFLGVAVSMIGLMLVLDFRGSTLDLVGVLAALAAAVCLASYFLVSAKESIDLPPVAFTGLGMCVGTLAIAVVNLTGLMPGRFVRDDVAFAGLQVSWLVPLILVVAFTVGAYVCGIIGLRYIGATIGSFINLLEVPFSAIAAWIILAELPTRIQLVGGAVIVIGIALIKWGDVQLERRLARARRGSSGDPSVSEAVP